MHTEIMTRKSAMSSVNTENPIRIVEDAYEIIRDCALYMADIIDLAVAIDPEHPYSQAKFTAELQKHLPLLRANADAYARLVAAIEPINGKSGHPDESDRSSAL
jgi:hypothetical protein